MPGNLHGSIAKDRAKIRRDSAGGLSHCDLSISHRPLDKVFNYKKPLYAHKLVTCLSP